MVVRLTIPESVSCRLKVQNMVHISFWPFSNHIRSDIEAEESRRARVNFDLKMWAKGLVCEWLMLPTWCQIHQENCQDYQKGYEDTHYAENEWFPLSTIATNSHNPFVVGKTSSALIFGQTSESTRWRGRILWSWFFLRIRQSLFQKEWVRWPKGSALSNTLKYHVLLPGTSCMYSTYNWLHVLFSKPK